MHRLNDILLLIPKDDNFVIDTLLELQFGKLATKYIKSYIRGDRTVFETREDLLNLLNDPYCKYLSDTPLPLNELFVKQPEGMFKDMCHIVYG